MAAVGIVVVILASMLGAVVGFGVAAMCAAAGQDSRDREYVQSLMAAIRANPGILKDWERASREH